MRIFLIGMPGSGKSHWMRKLAHHLKYDGLDLDVFIETTEQQTIASMFEMGEDHFRKKETKALKNTIEKFQDNFIIATGGGVPFFYDNMEWMKKNGTVVYLNADVDYLFKNLVNAYVERPLLKSGSKEEVLDKLSKLYEKRKEIYQQAHHIIDIEGATLSTFAEILGF